MKSLVTILFLTVSFVRAAAAVGVAEPPSEPVRLAPNRPNVLFIALDDLRPELGCYGQPQIKSPNIDRLAATGVRFTHAYCQQAVCGASRASLLTGLRPDSTGVHGNATHFRKQAPDVVTLPQHFKQHGYHVEGMGKIFHEARGFTQFGDPASWSVPMQFPSVPTLKWCDPKHAALVAEKLAALRRQGRSDWDAYSGARGPAYESPDIADTAYHDGELAEMATAALKRLASGKAPFFLAVGFQKPHLPFCAPKSYWDLYDPAEIRLSRITEWPKDSPLLAHTSWGELRSYHGVPKSGPVSDEEARKLIHGYYASVSYADAQIGKVVAALDTLGLSGNTIVILWGDHGWKLSEYSAWSKATNYELDTRAPLMIRVPGMKGAGAKSDALVEFVDIYPTLADLCGLPAPRHGEGTSLVPLLDSPDRAWKPAAFSQFPRGARMGYSMRTAQWRYTEWLDQETKTVTARELYDHQSESVEQVNLANDPRYAETVKALSRQLQKGSGWRQCRTP